MPFIPNRQAELAYIDRAMEIATSRLKGTGEPISYAKATAVLNDALEKAYREALGEYERQMAQHRALPFFQRLKSTAPSKPMDPIFASTFLMLALPNLLERLANAEERVAGATARIRAANAPAVAESKPAPTELDKKLAVLEERKRELAKLDQALADELITAEDAQLLRKNIHDRAKRKLDAL